MNNAKIAEAVHYSNKIKERKNNLNKYLGNMDINKLKNLLNNMATLNKLSEKFFISTENVKKIILKIISNHIEFKKGFGIDLPNTYCPKLEPVDKSQEINK